MPARCAVLSAVAASNHAFPDGHDLPEQSGKVHPVSQLHSPIVVISVPAAELPVDVGSAHVP